MARLLAGLSRLPGPPLSESAWARLAAAAAALYPGLSRPGPALAASGCGAAPAGGGMGTCGAWWGEGVGGPGFECVVRAELQRAAARDVAAAVSELAAASARLAAAAAAAAECGGAGEGDRVCGGRLA